MAMICRQVLDLGRQRAEAVDQLGGEGVDLAHGRAACAMPPVEAEADAEIGDVALGDQHRHADVDLRRPGPRAATARRRRAPPAPPLPACAGRARCRPRGCGPDCSSPSRLPAPRMSRSWLARVKPAPSVVQRLHDLEAALLGPTSALHAVGKSQIGIAALLRAADAAAQLIELRQAEHVGAMDDDGVGRRDVEAGFDDAGGQQQVVLAVVERRHGLLELAVAGIWPWAIDELDLRHQLAQARARPCRGPRCAGRRRRSGRRGKCSRRIASRRMHRIVAAARRCAPPAGRPAAWR